MVALRLAGRSKKTIILINLASLILIFFQWQDFWQFRLFWRFWRVTLLEMKETNFVDGGQGAEVLLFDADLTVKGLDKVLFDAEGQFSLQTACNVFIGLNRENAVPISSCNSEERFNGDFFVFQSFFFQRTSDGMVGLLFHQC